MRLVSKMRTALEVASGLAIETSNLSIRWRSDVEVRISPAKILVPACL